MATPSASGEPASGSEQLPSDHSQRRHPTSRISHIVRTYLDLSSSSKKRHASPRSHSEEEAHAAGGEADAGMVGEPTAQPSRLLRELGIRVSRYTHEERRDIILRYMQKRSGRQVVNRAASKIPSRQALAERRRRGAGGKFLGKEDPQTTDKQEAKVQQEPELPPEVISNAGGVPIVGMVFDSEEKAFEYYVCYAGNVGFSVRKGWWDKTTKNSSRSRVYVCSREGFRSKKEAKRPHVETRMGCPARVAIQLTPSGKYRVTEFVEDHNHQLAAPFDIEMLKSQRALTDTQHGNQNASKIPPGYKNYLRSKSTKDVKPGDLKALMNYFRRMKSDNPSFYYAIQVDENDKAANVFWADARSIMDYHYFGDVICFDMIYKVNDLSRPLVLFLGMNHHRQMIIFGSAFLYDETVESFKWLLETFDIAMCGKHPKTILTDRSAALTEALSLMWPATIHSACIWQIYQNTVKSLAEVFGSYEEFTHELRHCLFDVEDEQEFLNTWNVVMEKYSLKEDDRFIKLYEDRENWALPYIQQIFFGDIKSMLLTENFGMKLKEYLGPETDLSLFLNFFESSAEKRRQEEMQADYQANQEAPRTPIPLMWQAANVYTPVIFDLFRKEYELSIGCMAYCCGEFGSLSEYMVNVRNRSKDQLVRYDLSDGTVACTCKKFENIGLLCCHILKVYELRNVKEIPPHYLLKRWRKDAKAVTMDAIDGSNFDNDTKSSIPGRYAALCRLFYNIAAKAAGNIETSALMAGQSDELLAKVDKILQSTFANNASGNSSKDQLTRMIQNEYLRSGSNEAQAHSGNKLEVGRRKNDMENNKRKKARKDIVRPDETVAGPRGELNIAPGITHSEPRNASNQVLTDQLMQGHYVLGHNFELGSSQNIHDNINQFDQSSVSTMQQQPFPGNGQLTEVYPGDMHALQFVGANPQIDNQSDDQGQSSIPVWDFL